MHQYCAACLWFGRETELKNATSRDYQIDCCPQCHGEDVFVLRVLRCLSCQYIGDQADFFGGRHFDEKHPVTDLGLTPHCPHCEDNKVADVTDELLASADGRTRVEKLLKDAKAAHVSKWRAEEASRRDNEW